MTTVPCHDSAQEAPSASFPSPTLSARVSQPCQPASPPTLASNQLDDYPDRHDPLAPANNATQYTPAPDHSPQTVTESQKQKADREPWR